MQAQLRFREIGREQKAHYVAWFKPAHRIVEAAAPFFASRFAEYALVDPDAGCLRALGRPRGNDDAGRRRKPPAPVRLEETWRRYCCSRGFAGKIA